MQLDLAIPESICVFLEGEEGSETWGSRQVRKAGDELRCAHGGQRAAACGVAGRQTWRQHRDVSGRGGLQAGRHMLIALGHEYCAEWKVVGSPGAGESRKLPNQFLPCSGSQECGVWWLPVNETFRDFGSKCVDSGTGWERDGSGGPTLVCAFLPEGAPSGQVSKA